MCIYMYIHTYIYIYIYDSINNISKKTSFHDICYVTIQRQRLNLHNQDVNEQHRSK